MRQLIKYFSKKEYADAFVNGKLYMNSLAYFWENGFEEQGDIFEGLSDTIDKKKLGAPVQMQQITNGDWMFRLEAYRYCNLYCFYRVDISDELMWNASTPTIYPDTRCINLPPENMKKFGEYVGIVKNEKEFVNRIMKALQAEWLCVTGDVKYRKRKGSKGVNGGLVMASSELYPAAHFMRNGANRTSARDCFEKTEYYQEQKEWRICLFRNEKSDEPYVLEIGDLKDIIDIVPADEVKKYLCEKYSPCIGGEVYPQRGNFIGNVTREEFKEKLYAFDDGNGKLMFVVG